MDLSELVSFFVGKYNLREHYLWPDYPGASEICHPATGKRIALLMQQWDEDTGTFIQRCDLKCGREILAYFHPDWLKKPFQMQGGAWLGIEFKPETDNQVVYRLFDRAIQLGKPGGFTMVLEAPEKPSGSGSRPVYRDIPLPFAGKDDLSGPRIHPPGEQETAMTKGIPPRILQMIDLYDPADRSPEHKARNFIRQGKFMENYEDDFRWFGDFRRYFPVYHDMNVRQLRAYFSWRTHVRKGEFLQIPDSMVYVYLYELLNGIGTRSPEETLEKMQAVDRQYADHEPDRTRMQVYIHQWMFEYAILHGLPADTVKALSDPGLVQMDRALGILQQPEDQTDEAVGRAMQALVSDKEKDRKVFTLPDGRGQKLFGQIWKEMKAGLSSQGKDLFSLCFGKRKVSSWYPLSNAVFDPSQQDLVNFYAISGNWLFRKAEGRWLEESYWPLPVKDSMISVILRTGDRMLRPYLRTGSRLKARSSESWIEPFVQTVIDADRQLQEKARIEAARPKIEIDFSTLAHIRQDAVVTRENLLTEEERQEEESAGGPHGQRQGTVPFKPPVSAIRDPAAHLSASEKPAQKEAAASVPFRAQPLSGSSPDWDLVSPDLCFAGLDPVHLEILHQLLAGKPVQDLIRNHHLMPAIVTDTINEALYDELGDNALECEGDRIILVEDYKEDILDVLQGDAND